MRHLMRLDNWQRCLRQLVGVSIRGLDVPANLRLELHTPPPPTSIDVALTVCGGTVRLFVKVHAKKRDGPEGEPLLYRSETVCSTANPTWSFEPLPLGPHAGALRSVHVMVCHVDLSNGAEPSVETPVVWQRTVIFEKLVRCLAYAVCPQLTALSGMAGCRSGASAHPCFGKASC